VFAIVIGVAAGSLLLAGCGLFGGGEVLIRSDMSLQGMNQMVQYILEGTPDGASEVNRAVLQGVNGESPLPLLTTAYGRGAGAKTQTVQVTTPDGSAANVLGMTKRQIKFGLTNFLRAEIATYEMRDIRSHRTCGAKVRLTFLPNALQFLGGDKRSWDALFYYGVPCQINPLGPLDLNKAKFLALVVDQQFTPRVTGRPVLFNRGHSVTVVDGAASRLPGGWWDSNAQILRVAGMVRDLAHDLDRHQWLDLSRDGEFGDSQLIYSAGDADVYNLRRAFLNRQSDYVVHFRPDPSQSWHVIVIHPQYNKEWNDFSQNWRALTGKKMPNIDDKVDQTTGLPKDLGDKELKEIETVGCQNCPNPELEQIQFLDGATGQPRYAMTIRGYLGANSSLVMFGQIPRVSLGDALTRADDQRERDGQTNTNPKKDADNSNCPVQRNDKGELEKDQISPKHCAELLREGALWDLITRDPSTFGFDVVSQLQVRDNSTYASRCSGSGDATSCETVRTNEHLDASYLFDTKPGDPRLAKAWTIMQLLGEVGVRTLGVSYASGLYAGNGLLFAMAQPLMYGQYFSTAAASLTSPPAAPAPGQPTTPSGSPATPMATPAPAPSSAPAPTGVVENPEMVFAFDARALQLPNTLAQAELALAR